MNPIDQLAAEAWQKIQYYYTPDMTGHTARTGEAIIKSACEKAVEPWKQRYELALSDSQRRGEALDRAAHASEHPHANWCQSLPPFNANCNCGAAHASEVTKEKE